MEHSMQYDELWDAYRAGSKSAFSDIYRRYGGPLLNYGSKITADTALVEDSFQDLFVELWDSRKRVSRTTSVKFYLFRALRNKILRNRRLSYSEKNEPLENHMSLMKTGSFEDHFIELEREAFQMQRLRENLEKLPLRQREAINLRYLHSFSNEEIAGIMGISYSSTCKFIYAGLKKLTENFKMAVM
jgi:RNA polymerase sigma factor (sigma-70 family)